MIRYSTPDVANRLGGTAAIMSSVTARKMGAQLPYADALHRASLEYRTPTTHEQRQLIFVSLCIYVSNDNSSGLYIVRYRVV
jgi:hypothetical protein